MSKSKIDKVYDILKRVRASFKRVEVKKERVSYALIADRNGRMHKVALTEVKGRPKFPMNY